MQRYIYIVFSSTPYFIGKAIRCITGAAYNHTSIALDPELKKMYGFARRYYRTPLYGGFTHETLSRFHINSKSSHICICAVPVTPEQYADLESLLAQMHRNKDRYLYNHFSAIMTPLRKPIPAKDAYTCVEFCVNILHRLDIIPDPQKYYSIKDLQQLLQPYIIFTGTMPFGDFDTAYYAKKPVPYPTLTTIRDLLKLFPRLGA